MKGNNPITTFVRLLTHLADCAVLAMLWLATPGAFALDGTYRVTETWRVTLEYDNWGGTGYTGTKTFSGTQSGTMVFRGNTYMLVNRAGVQLSGIDDLTTRTIFYSGGNASVSGSYVFGPAFGATARGIVFLGAFIVSVPLLDGEVPAFFGFDRYSGSGPLSSITGGGDMRGPSLTATVSSTLSLERVLGPPSIVTQPQGQSVFAGQDAIFNVTAGGDGPLSYLWRKNGAVLPGRTGTILRLTNVQPADAGAYSVIVSNSTSKVTSANATLTVKAPPPAWSEGWESSPLGIRRPSSNVVTFVSGDKGRWVIGDTVSHFDDCGPIENYTEVLNDGGRKLLRLVSRRNDLGCAENIDVQISQISSSSLPLPLVRGTEISFFESGAMDDPQWNGLFGCIVRPCGDTVHLRLVDDRANEVLYIFQRAPNYVEHAFTNGPSLSGYLEVFLDPAGGTFRRNLFDDFARIAGAAGPGKTIQGVGFAMGAAGWAMLDDLRIGPTNAAASDTLAPSVVITSPANNARLLNPSAMLTGTARDNVAVSVVEYQINGGAFQPAAGTTAWTASVALMPGVNTIRVRAKDAAGNTSPEVSRSLTYVLSAVLTLEITGQGTVSPNLDGQRLEVGKSYILTPKPASGFVFAGWSGDIVSASARLTFLMQPALMLTASFIPNPFIPIKGTYNGLFYELGGARQESSGCFTLTLTDRGSYTARLQLGGRIMSASGVFNLAGRATNVIARPGTNALMVDWKLDSSGGIEQVTGRVGNGSWIANLLADRASTNAGVYQGKYTLAILGQPDSSVAPGGDGFGSVVIDTRGNLSFSGTLADGTAVRQRVPVSRDGHWPFCAWPYAGKGPLIGWVNFGDDGTNDFAGLMHWFKPGAPTSKYYPAGFAIDSWLIGSRYMAPTMSNRVLNLTNGRLLLSGAGVETTNDFMLLPNNKIVAAVPGSATVTLDLLKGFFSGSVTPPGRATGIPIKGALLQRQSQGAGFFLNSSQSGGVRVEPSP